MPMRGACSMRGLTALACAVLCCALPARAEPRVFRVDSGRSHVRIEVGKAGLLSFAGHTHEVLARALEGEVQFDPAAAESARVWVEIDAAALEVTGKGEPAEDVPEVQATMLGERVLDVSRHPTIRFESSAVEVRARREGSLDLAVDGRLTLHGVTRPVRVELVADVGPGTILARGRMSIRQTEFGIQPVSAAGGTVKVKDLLWIDLTLAATAE